MSAAEPPAPVEIAAGTLQLTPATDDDLLRAEAGGLAVTGAALAWAARDIVTAEPHAWVVLHDDHGRARVGAVVAPAGSGDDVVAARDVVRRYAREALGLTDDG